MKNILEKRFNEVYKSIESAPYFSPARVNLIGEHIDYNGGFVFPCALSFGTYGSVSKRDDLEFHVYSEGFSNKPYIFTLNSLVKDKNNEWVDYIKGVFISTLKRGYKIDHGFNLYIYGNMPNGAGLSSSASLESLIVTILSDMFNLNISLEEKALIGKEAENNFVGVNSGIMDQFAVLAGKLNHAILLNTETLDYKYAPLDLGNYTLLISNTNKKRGLADSKYNERFSECQESLKILAPIYNVKNLCQIPVSALPEIKNLLNDTLYKRVSHVITEQQRTIDATKALENNNVLEFANLMSNSHYSLQHDYDVTGIELDTLQSLLIENGAIGARMTGAGFGGCCVAIVHKDKLDNLKENILVSYKEKIGYAPSFYEAMPSEGTSKL